MRKVEKDKIAGSENPIAISASANVYKKNKPSNALSTILKNRNLAESSRYDLARQEQQDTQTDAPSYLPPNRAILKQVLHLPSVSIRVVRCDKETDTLKQLLCIITKAQREGALHAKSATKPPEPTASRHQVTDNGP